MGVCVLVGGAVVAWFVEFTEEAREWCTENYFGQWLTWRGAPPIPVPLTAEEMSEISRRAEELAEGLGFKGGFDALQGNERVDASVCNEPAGVGMQKSPDFIENTVKEGDKNV